MPASEALSREKHETILDAAGRLFEARGFEGAGMAAITAAAGVSKSTIYHHFGSKAGLFGAYVKRECRRSLKPIFETMDGCGDERETLRDIGLRMLTLLVSPIGMTIDRIVMAEAERFPDLAEAFFAAGPGTAIGAMALWLESRAAQGRLHIGDPRFAAEQFFALCQTQAVLKRKLRLSGEIPPAVIEVIVDGAVAMFLKAYANPAFQP